MTPDRGANGAGSEKTSPSPLEVVRDIAFIGAIYTYFAGFRYLEGVNDQFNIPGHSLSDVPVYQVFSYGGTVVFSNVNEFGWYALAAIGIALSTAYCDERLPPRWSGLLRYLVWLGFAAIIFWRLFGLADRTATRWVRDVMDCTDSPRVRLALTDDARRHAGHFDSLFLRLNDAGKLRLIEVRPNGVVVARRWSVWYKRTSPNDWDEQRIIVTYIVPSTEYTALSSASPGFNCASSSVHFSDVPGVYSTNTRVLTSPASPSAPAAP